MKPKLTHIEHPLVQYKLSLMRKKETSSQDFRMLMAEYSACRWPDEVTRDLPIELRPSRHL
jgi:uracil phosphoribosyltransferase